MNRTYKFYSLVLIVIFFTLAVFAQTGGLPRIRKSENYKTVRVKMLKAGWKPFHSKEADKCYENDERCQGRPEMNHCAGTGLGNCEFLWKRKGKTVAIFTAGEETTYSGYEFQ